jgi:hypothetical protein
MDMLKTIHQKKWDIIYDDHLTQEITAALEEGKVVFLPELEFELKPEERFLLSPKYSNGRSKNISFNLHQEKLSGENANEEGKKHLRRMMRRFALSATSLMHTLFPTYAKELKIARTSYRPVEALGRKSSSYKKDDTRLHVDAFPATPNYGHRIIRVFSNINPEGKGRHWRLGEPFETVAKRFLPQIKKPLIHPWLLKQLRVTKGLRSAYDHIMLEMHHRMKKDLDYQKNAEQIEISMPAGATWIVKTDVVSHAAMSGQFLLEQTFHLPVYAMLDEQQSPLRILERLTKRALV